MANLHVELVIRIRTSEGKRRYKKPFFARNGKLKPLCASVRGQPEYHAEGVYCLRYRESGKRIWKVVGQDPDFALTEKLKREQILRARQLGIKVVEEDRDAARLKVQDAVASFLNRIRLTRSKKTQSEFTLMLPQFAESCCRTHLDEVTGDDIMDFAMLLREQGFGDRTVANRVNRVLCFFKKNGIANLLDEGDKQSLKYVEKVVDAYTSDELAALFAVATEEERLIFQFFLGSGCREAEVANATWRDVNFSDKTVVVHTKPKRGFKPKDKAERRIPVPDSLIDALKQWRRKHPDCLYLFPNEHGRPNGHLLRMLKKLGKRAGLNCGECFAVGEGRKQTCLTAAVCEKFQLHKFRRTFATFHHEHGVPVRTIQLWLGHEDLETTLRYLQISDARSEQSRNWVNNSFAGVIV